MSWPENDPYLHELRRKWDEGHFRQDNDSVYGVDEAIEEAIEDITKDDDRPKGFGEGQTLTGTAPSIDIFDPFSGRPTPGEKINDFLSRKLAEGMVDDINRQFGGKTCRICRLTTVNDPCDDCYSRWRRALQTISNTGICELCKGRSPSVICVTCVGRVLRDGLGNGREKERG